MKPNSYSHIAQKLPLTPSSLYPEKERKKGGRRWGEERKKGRKGRKAEGKGGRGRGRERKEEREKGKNRKEKKENFPKFYG